MNRRPGHISPSDRDGHHLVRISDEAWQKLQAEAWSRGISRGALARRIVEFVLDEPEVLRLLMDEGE